MLPAGRPVFILLESLVVTLPGVNHFSDLCVFRSNEVFQRFLDRRIAVSLVATAGLSGLVVLIQLSYIL